MDNLAYTALWLLYNQSSVVSSPEPRQCSRLSVKLLTSLTCGLVVSGSFGIPARANWGRVVYVNTPPGYALNVRWGPGTQFGVYRKVLRGTDLRLAEVRRNGWLQLTDGTWVAGNLVSSRPVYGHDDSSTDGKLAYVVTPPNLALNIRTGPGTTYPRVGQFLNGTQVRLSRRYSGNWAELTDGNWVDDTFLRSDYPDNNQPTSPDRPAYNPDVINLQERLKQLGYLSSTFVPNGIYDETTQQAVREFQRINGLPVTGVVDAATWQALYEATEPNPTPTPTYTPTPTPTYTPPPTPTPTPTGSGQEMRVVIDDESTVVFAAPDPSSEILRTIPNGSTVLTTGQISGNWTELSDGGWVFSLYLEPM